MFKVTIALVAVAAFALTFNLLAQGRGGLHIQR